MRTFYAEVRAEAPERKRGQGVRQALRWATALFALACLWIDARLVLGAAQEGLYAVLFRSVLLEVEAYLAIVAALMTIRYSAEAPERASGKTRRRAG